MKRAFLLMVVPALLVALGFAQTPAPSSNSGNTDQVNIKGCLGGSDGNFTVAEDNTGKIFKITTSSADLKAYVGQDVNLTGNKAGAGENSVAVTGLNMISEHCTAAAAAPAASVSAPAETTSTPVVAAAPAATAPAATASTPAETVGTPPAAATTAVAPDATVSTPAATAPAVAPDATVSTPAQTASTPPAPAAPVAATAAPAPAAETASAPAAAAAPVHRTRPSARARKSSATPAAAAAPAEPVSTPVADAAAIPPAGPPPATANTPAAPAATATPPATGRSVWMLASIVVVVLLIGTAVPLYNRWRKRKLLEQTKGQNLSFTKEAKSDPGRSDTTGGRKAA